MKTNSKLFEFPHDDLINLVKIVGKLIVTCADKTVRIWSLENGELLDKLQLADACTSFDLNSDQTLMVVAHHKGVSIWNFSSMIKITEIALDIVTDVRFNDHGTQLIVGQFHGQVSKIDLY